MGSPTAASLRIRAALVSRRADVDEVLARYGARSVRVFGSVARGDATESSDLDLLVDLCPDGGNPLLRLSGLSEELSDVIGVRVDVLSEPLMRDRVSASALRDAVAL